MIRIDRATGQLTLDEPPNGESWILYGSYARGDFADASDVDVLRITTERGMRVRVDGQVVVHTYALNDLLQMARRGSLFVLHVLQEGVVLHDPPEVLETIRAAFQPPMSYVARLRRDLLPATKILHVGEEVFNESATGFLNAAMFLCRSLMYAEHADRGPFSFSLPSLALEDDVARTLWAMKHEAPSYQHLAMLRQIVKTWYPSHPGQSHLIRAGK